jgi:hypothetical protein
MKDIHPMYWIGKLHAAVFKVPGIGEKIIRGQGWLTANLAFRLPVMGGKRCSSLDELRGEWLKFLGMAGVYPSASRETDTEFEMELDACAYGFRGEEQQGVCDACMDLDRAYVKLLGGELQITHSIPTGSGSCRFVIRLAGS